MAQWATDCEAIDFLEDRGFELLWDYSWKKPHETYLVDKEERGAIDYLMQEWDFNGLVAS